MIILIMWTILIKTFGASTWWHDESIPSTARGAVVVHAQVVPNLHDDDDDDDDDVDDEDDGGNYDETSWAMT